MIDNAYLKKALGESETPAEKAAREAAATALVGMFPMWLGVTITLTAIFGWVGFGASIGITGALLTRSALRSATKKAGELARDRKDQP